MQKQNTFQSCKVRIKLKNIILQWLQDLRLKTFIQSTYIENDVKKF